MTFEIATSSPTGRPLHDGSARGGSHRGEKSVRRPAFGRRMKSLNGSRDVQRDVVRRHSWSLAASPITPKTLEAVVMIDPMLMAVRHLKLIAEVVEDRRGSYEASDDLTVAAVLISQAAELLAPTTCVELQDVTIVLTDNFSAKTD